MAIYFPNGEDLRHNRVQILSIWRVNDISSSFHKNKTRG